MSSARERGYMPQLDALRFFAVTGVMIVHNWQPSPGTLIVGQVDWAELGVKLFFVLSGFLITGILIGGRELVERDSERRLFVIRQLYIRRFLRIFPVYYGGAYCIDPGKRRANPRDLAMVVHLRHEHLRLASPCLPGHGATLLDVGDRGAVLLGLAMGDAVLAA
jgi:hypothetical protein